MRINLWPDQLSEQDFEMIVDVFPDRKQRDIPF